MVRNIDKPRLTAAEIRNRIIGQMSSDRNKRNATFVNDIAPVPPIVNPQRREACSKSLKLYAETYYPNRFNLKWSDDHLELVSTIEQSILSNVASKYAFACMRGFGKTSLVEVAAKWALDYGYKRFVVLVAASGERQNDMFDSLVSELESNELLLDDFPEIHYPIHRLEGTWSRVAHQHIEGVNTNIVLKKGKIVYPTVAGSKVSGATIRCASIGSSGLRGRKHTLADGTIIRPDLIVFDDVQTDKTAKSDISVSTAERIINAAVSGMAGPNSAITALMPCTVIRSNDVSERFINRIKKPQWNGIRKKLVIAFPVNMDLWQEYWRIKQESFRNGGRGYEATEFYRINRPKMDEGAIVSWAERYEPGQLSAVEYAMSLYFDDPVAFFCEFQNDPDNLEIRSLDGLNLKLDAKLLEERTSGLLYGVAPRNTLYLTGGIDIQKEILFYSISAWTENLGGVLLDYGSYPEQPYRDGWTGAKPLVSLSSKHPNIDLHARIYLGLKYLRDNVFTKTFKRDQDDKETLNVEKVLIDTNWSQVADVPYAFCREQASINKFLPAAGKGVGASMVPMDQWAMKRGEIRCKDTGMWRILTTSQSQNRGKHVSFDTNFWKDIVAERLNAPLGNPEAITFWGDQQYQHDFLCLHLSSEYPVEEIGRGRKVNQWKQRPDKPDNHWFDTLILSTVAAAILGVTPHPRAEFTDDGKIVTTKMPKKERRIVSVPQF